MTAMTVTDAGLNMLRDGNKGTGAVKVLYLALGTDATAPSIAQTKLLAEAFRKAITTYANGASPGASVISAYVGPDEAVGVNIAEVGWFIGNATSTANSGTLLARALYSPAHVKTSSESFTFQLDLANIRG
jgi:hypothetical protein